MKGTTGWGKNVCIKATHSPRQVFNTPQETLYRWAFCDVVSLSDMTRSVEPCRASRFARQDLLELPNAYIPHKAVFHSPKYEIQKVPKSTELSFCGMSLLSLSSDFDGN